MPSWNVHTAHVERLLTREGASALGVRDANAFLLGNLLPDLYVGYMVQPITRKIPYAETHLTKAEFIPLPDHEAFWRRYVERAASPDAPAAELDLVLGAWCHLATDAVYNAHTRAFLAERALKAGERIRILKQGDFDVFGRTLDITSRLEATDDLLAAAAAFPQYPVNAADVRAAVRSLARVVGENRERHVEGTPTYELLTPQFFSEASTEAHELLAARLRGHAGR